MRCHYFIKIHNIYVVHPCPPQWWTQDIDNVKIDPKKITRVGTRSSHLTRVQVDTTHHQEETSQKKSTKDGFFCRRREGGTTVKFEEFVPEKTKKDGLRRFFLRCLLRPPSTTVHHKTI